MGDLSPKCVFTSCEHLCSELDSSCEASGSVVNIFGHYGSVTFSYNVLSFTFTFKSFSRRSYPERLTNW
jgi:hypothetical protein